MARENPYFLISGFLSLSLFLLFLFLFFYMIFSKTKIETFALKKDNYISISLDLVPSPSKTIKTTISIPKKEVQSVKEIKELDISDLFSNVFTKDISKKVNKKKVNNKRLELIKKKIKKSKNNIAKEVSQLITNNDANVIDTQTKKSSSAHEVNEYFARIQGIIYKYFIPPANSGGNTVKIVIELSAIGKVLDFRILTYSANKALNDECDKIKNRLLGVLFPINPENKSFKTIVNITSDK